MSAPKRTKTRTPGIFKTGQATYEVFVRLADPVTGKARQTSRTFPTEKAAKEFLNEHRALKDKGLAVHPGRQTFREYLDVWIDTRTMLKPTTLASYRAELRKVPGWLGHKRLADVTARDIEKLTAELLATPKRNGTGTLGLTSVRYVTRVLNSALTDAVRKGFVERNPVALADKPGTRHVEMDTWTSAELSQFLRSVEGDRLHAAFVLLAHTGARRGELLGLRWGDIDLERGTVSVRRSVVAAGYAVHIGEPKTAAGIRSIDIGPDTVAALKAHRRRQAEERLSWGPAYEDNGLAFCAENGSLMHPQSLSRSFERAVKRSGVRRIRLHDVRHTAASLMLAAGVPVLVVSRRLGHASPTITLSVYGHVVPGQDAAAAAAMETLLREALSLGGGQ